EERAKWNSYIKDLIGFNPRNLLTKDEGVIKATSAATKVKVRAGPFGREYEGRTWVLPEIKGAWRAYFGFAPVVSERQKKILQSGWPGICGKLGSKLKFFEIPQKIFSEGFSGNEFYHKDVGWY
ncbi:unnamed protein product, partial [marine sediment metagenome]